MQASNLVSFRMIFLATAFFVDTKHLSHHTSNYTSIHTLNNFKLFASLYVCTVLPIFPKRTKRASQFDRLTVSPKPRLLCALSAPNNGIHRWAHPGCLLPSISAKVLREGKELEVGEGEVGLIGPKIFKGYYNNPQATAEAFDAERWYHSSGDVRKFDQHDNLYITDRLKEPIKYNGYQAAPTQLEGLLLSHPSVADVVVIAVWSGSRVTELSRAHIAMAARYKSSKKLEEEVHKSSIGICRRMRSFGVGFDLWKRYQKSRRARY
jgi:acyl-CoA synthetase (AMP-forming)/AMP-acid ligase II